MKEQSDLISPEKELDPKPRVLVTFFGENHHEINLQNLDLIKEALTQHLEKSSGRQIVLLETPYASISEVESYKKDIKEHGFHIATVGRQMARIYRQPVSPYLVRSFIEKVSRSSRDDLVGTLIPIQGLREYFFSEMFEGLQKRYGFEIEFETHTKQVQDKRVEKIRQWLEIQYAAIKDWHEGKFWDFLDKWKAYFVLDDQSNLSREEDLVSDISKIIKKLYKEKSGGSLFILMGSNHALMMDRIKQKTSRFGAVFEVILTTYEEIHSKMRKGDQVPDLLYAQEFFSRQLAENIAQTLIGQKRYFFLASNLETIIEVSEQIARDYSLEEIRKICEAKTDLIPILKNHPLIKPYLS